MPRLTRRQYQLQMHDLIERMRSRATVAADDSDSARRARRERARADRLWGLGYYFPHYFDAPFAECHHAIIESSDVKGTPTVIHAPRGSGKSTVAMGLEVLKITLAEEHFLIIGSQTEDLATGHTIPIRLELEENPRLTQDFGELKGNYKWEEGDFITKNRVRVLARGIGQKVRGLKYRQYRPGYFRLDDTEDDESAINPKRVKKLLNWISKSVIPAGQEAGLEATLLFIGTLSWKRSAIDHLFHNPEYSAWRRFHFKSGLHEGKSYWPEKYSVADLERIRDTLGSKAYQGEMDGEPRDEEGDFQEQWIRYYHPLEIRDVRDSVPKATAIDPSVEAGSGRCYKAIVTVGLIDGKIYVLDAFIRHCSIARMVEATYDVHNDFNPTVIGLEDVLFQKLLYDDYDAMAKVVGYNLPLTGVEQKENKELRIRRLSPLVERGRILFDRTQGDQKLLIEQLLNFPSGEIDGPDALEMAVRLLQRAAQKMEYTTVERRRFAVGAGAW